MAEDTVTKDMKIQDIVQEHPEVIAVFMKHGLHCIGCAAAHFENLAQGCEAHGIDADAIVKEMNELIEKKE